jgi:hypothetical protein
MSNAINAQLEFDFYSTGHYFSNILRNPKLHDEYIFDVLVFHEHWSNIPLGRMYQKHDLNGGHLPIEYNPVYFKDDPVFNHSANQAYIMFVSRMNFIPEY